MRMIVLVHDEYTLDGPPHSALFVIVLEALEACGHRGILLRLGFLRAEGVVG